MANLPTPPTPTFPDVYQLETTDRVLGGADGIANLQAKQLLERTAYLKKQIDDAVAGALVMMYAQRLKSARTIALSGDVSGSGSFDGSANLTISVVYKASGVAAGTYTKVTVDAKGTVTAGGALTAADIPALDWSKITTGKPTTLAGYGITDASLAILTDTTITSPAAGHLLRWSGSKWVNAALAAADIPALDWSKITTGKPSTLDGYGITDAVTAARQTATLTTTAGGWQRIASSALGIARNSGEFVVDWTVSGDHGAVRLAACCHYGSAGSVSIQQLEYGTFGSRGITEARVVYHPTYSGNYCYLEVKFAGALTGVKLSVEGRDLIGWTLLDPSTAGGVPSGYSSYVHTLVAMAAIPAGRYTRLTVNQEGRVVGGDNPATLADMGITDGSRQILPLAASVAGGAMTVTLGPTSLDFHAPTGGDGAVNTRVIGAPLSLTIPAGATLNAVSGQPARLVVIALDNAGTVELAVANVNYSGPLDECSFLTTATISASASNNGPFSATARTNLPYRVVGFVDSTQATAGQWLTAPSRVQGAGGQALTALSALGYGQSWQNVTRAPGTTYYNTTGRPIQLVLIMQGTWATLTINGLAFAQFQGASNAYPSYSFVIPPGSSYSFTGTVLATYELR